MNLSREQILEAAKEGRVLATRGQHTLLSIAAVRELIVEGKASIIEGNDALNGEYVAFLKVTQH